LAILESNHLQQQLQAQQAAIEEAEKANAIFALPSQLFTRIK